MKRKVARPGRIKSAILSWLGVEQMAGGFDRVVSDAGALVSAERALTISAVWACTRLVSQTIASLPLGMYERTADGRKSADDLQLARVLSSRPNVEMSAVVFWEAIIGQAVLVGNGFARKLRVGSRIVGLELMPANRMTWRRLASGRYEFRYVDGAGKEQVLQEEDVFHLPGFTLWGRFGMSVVRYGAQVFGSGLAANNAANATFKNGLMPTTYFKMDKVLTRSQREDFRENLAEITGALNAGKQPLLEGGMEVGGVGINPADAQLLESRAFSVEEICRWFGVPPSMVGATDKASSWASSSESLNLWFLQYGLRPWLRRIEQAIWKDLLSPADQSRYYAEFAVEGLLRANIAGRTQFYSTALQNGWMNRNEVRRLENLPPVEGGEIYTAQSNLLPLDQLGAAQQAGAQSAQDALKAWLGITEPRSEHAATQE